MTESLQRKFLLPITFGAFLLIIISAFVTHAGLLPELRSQLHKRAELMLITIRAAAEINPGYQDLRLALEEITLQTSGVYGITLATRNPTIVWASSTHPDADLDQHTGEMLELLKRSAKENLFGSFIHNNGDLVVISPFKLSTPEVDYKKVLVSKSSLPSGVEASDTFTLTSNDYEGILYLRFNWAEVELLANSTLTKHMMAMSAVIILMLLLSTATVYKVILNPILAISRTINSQKQGRSEARTINLTSDEIGILGHSMNEMLDDLNNRERLLKAVVEHLPAGLCLKGVNGTKIIQNEVYNTSYLSPFLDGDVRTEIQDRHRLNRETAIDNRTPSSYEEQISYSKKDKHFETTIFPIFNKEKDIEWLGTLCLDVSEKKERELQLIQLYKAVESVKSGIIICIYQEPDFPIIYVNPAVTELTGYSPSDVIGKHPRIFSTGSTDLGSLNELKNSIKEKKPCTVIIKNYRKDGTSFWNEFTLSVITNNEGNATHLVGIQNDVTERIDAANEIEHLAYFDSLTNIPNRTLFHDRLSQVIIEAHRNKQQVAVLYVDLDGFKAANDTFGHDAGDQLLKEATSRLSLCIRDQDSLARMGGDEFTLLISNLSSDDVVHNLPKVINRIQSCLSNPFDIYNNTIHISGSIGISIFPKDGDSAEELLMNSDHAMYHAKENGKNTFRFFQPEMNKAIEQQQNIESSLRKALLKKEFSLHYQPQLSLEDGSISVEALIRWNQENGESISPAEFIPIAEQSGLIDEIGVWVIKQACEDLAGFMNNKSKIQKVAINISPLQFKRQNLANIIKRYLDHYQINPHFLEIEITETVILNDFDSARVRLQELRNLGITIAIDDFGTGYSSLTYLKQLPIDTIKIDRQFIKGLPNNQDDKYIVRAIAGLADGMGLNLLAEGVETEAQLQFIKEEINCSQIQGFLISKPIDKKTLEASSFYK